MSTNRAVALNNLYLSLWRAAPVELRHSQGSWLNDECEAWVEWWEANKLSLSTLVLGPDLAPWITRYNAARTRLAREFPQAALPGVARDTTLLTPTREAIQTTTRAVENVATAAVSGAGLGLVIVGGLWLMSRSKGRR